MKQRTWVGVAIVSIGLGWALPAAAQSGKPEVSQPAPQPAAHEEYACPMHCEPGKTYPEVGRCPVCKMKLKPVSAMSYEAEVKPEGGALKGGQKGVLAISLTDPAGGPVKTFRQDGGADAHVTLIASGVGTVLQQAAKADGNGRLTAPVVLPAGQYAAVVAFLPAQGPAKVAVSRLNVSGAAPARAAAGPELSKDIQDYTVSLSGADALAAGKESELTLSIARGGKGVQLEPVLGEPARMIVASADLSQVAAAMAAQPKQGDAATTVPFRAKFDKSGLYRVWAEFRSGGTLIGVPLVVRVAG